MNCQRVQTRFFTLACTSITWKTMGRRELKGSYTSDSWSSWMNNRLMNGMSQTNLFSLIENKHNRIPVIAWTILTNQNKLSWTVRKEWIHEPNQLRTFILGCTVCALHSSLNDTYMLYAKTIWEIVWGLITKLNHNKKIKNSKLLLFELVTIGPRYGRCRWTNYD